MRWIIVVAIVLASHTARADDYPCFCASGTDYPDKGIPAGPDGTCESADRCQCSASCSGGGGGGGGQVNPAVANGAVKVLGGIFFTVAFLILPGHAAKLLSNAPAQSKADARKAFDDYVAKRKQLIQVGLDAQKLRDAYWKADAEARKELGEREILQRKLLEQKLLKPLVPRLLDASRDPHFQCDQARTAMPSVHTEGPIGPFENEEKMLATCVPLSEPPHEPDVTCSAASYRCGVGRTANDPELCCPRTHPHLNLCDWQCYRTMDFLGAKLDEGKHCGSSRDCATFNPTTPLPAPSPAPSSTP